MAAAGFDLPGADCRYDIYLEDRSMLQIIPLPDGGVNAATGAGTETVDKMMVF